MKLEQLRVWVNDPAQDPAGRARQAITELAAAGTVVPRNPGQSYLAAFNSWIGTQTDLTATSAWTPTGWVAPATPPAPVPAPVATPVAVAPAAPATPAPAPAVAPAPVVVHEHHSFNEGLLGGVVGACAGIVLVALGVTAVAQQHWFGIGNGDKVTTQQPAVTVTPPPAPAPATATSAPTGNTGSGTTTTAATSGCPDQDHHVLLGEKYETHRGCTVKGDVWLGSTSGSKEFKGFSGIADIGTLTTCTASSCWVLGEPGAANVSPRTAPDLKAEMLASGCGSKCATVNTLCWPNACTSLTNKDSVASSCGPELKRDETRAIPAGCIIVGDVFARRASTEVWIWTTDKVQGTGSVQKLPRTLEIKAPFGASVQDSSSNLKSLVETTKAIGCDLDDGCSGGVFGWTASAMDKLK